MSKEEQYMQVALEQAKMAAAIGEVPVGAVIVLNDEIIAAAHNKRELTQVATAHAELLAIEQACNAVGSWRLEQCQLYVTLEPCPMCMGAIINARIDSVFLGAGDPKAGCCGSIINLAELPFNHKPKIYKDILTDQCSGILQEFFRNLRNTKKIIKN